MGVWRVLSSLSVLPQSFAMHDDPNIDKVYAVAFNFGMAMLWLFSGRETDPRMKLDPMS